jgi:hypothetical protein
MSLFKKYTQLLELSNKFDHIENKIDILNSKFESMKFLDGCCDCKTRETKLYNDLKTFLDDKLLNLKETLLNLHDNLQEQKDTSTELKDKIEETCNICTLELRDVLQKASEFNTETRVDIQNELKKLQSKLDNTTATENISLVNLLETQFKNFESKLDNTPLINLLKHYNTLIQTELGKLYTFTRVFKDDLISDNTKKDLSLRQDLQEFLIGLQSNITTGLLNNKNEIITDLTSLVQKVNDIDVNVKSFYYDNEIIKHQLLLQEELQTYNIEIDNIRTLALNAKTSIEKTLSTLHNELN